MHKIPLESTIAGAYRFLFTKIVSVIGTLWLPFVVVALVSGGALYLTVPHEWLLGHFPTLHAKDVTPEALAKMLAPVMVLSPVFMLIYIVGIAMAFTGLMRHALGQKETPTFAYFSLGANVWRMAAAFVLSWLIIMVLFAVLVGVCVAFGVFGLSAVPKPWGGIILAVLIVVSVCFYFYSALRLTFFIPAVVVAENRVGLGRSWELGGGNFWRIFVVYLLILLPVGFVVAIIGQMTFMPVMMGHLVQITPQTPPAEAVKTMMHAILPVLPAMLVLDVLEYAAIFGLVAGAAGSAYKAVTGSSEAQDA